MIESIGTGLNNVTFHSGSQGTIQESNSLSYDGLLKLKPNVRKTIKMSSAGTVKGRGYGHRAYADASIYSDYSISIVLPTDNTNPNCCTVSSGIYNIGKSSPNSPSSANTLTTNAFNHINLYDITGLGWTISNNINNSFNHESAYPHMEKTLIQSTFVSKANCDGCLYLLPPTLINTELCRDDLGVTVNVNNPITGKIYRWYDSNGILLGAGNNAYLGFGSYSISIFDPLTGCEAFTHFSVDYKDFDGIIVLDKNGPSILGGIQNVFLPLAVYSPQDNLFPHFSFTHPSAFTVKWYDSYNNLLSIANNYSFNAIGNYYCDIKIKNCLMKRINISIVPKKGKLPLIGFKNSEMSKNSTGLEEIFPNPTSGIINFKINAENEKRATIVIFSLDGKLIQEQQVNFSGTNKFNLKENPPGTYLYRVIYENKRSTFGKFILLN